jgi:GAF domain-containing protein
MVTNTVGVMQREVARLQSDNQALQHENAQLRGFIDILNTLTAEEENLYDDQKLLSILRTVFHKAMDLLTAPEGSLLLLDEETNELKFVLVKGALAERLLDFRIPANEGIAGWVIQNARPALVRDVRHDSRFLHTIDEQFKFRTQSIAAVPLIGNAKVFGVMEALNQPSDEPFSDTDVTLLNLTCRFLGEILSNIEQRQPES